MQCAMACISASNPPVHKIGNSFKSMFMFHVTRIPVNVKERLDCILNTESQRRGQKACEEEKKGEKPKTKVGTRIRKWSHCGCSGYIDGG